jgi:hypothetical protein
MKQKHLATAIGLRQGIGVIVTGFISYSQNGLAKSSKHFAVINTNYRTV